MKTFDFKNCKSLEDVENVVATALQYETIVEDEEDAKRHFRECEINEDVETETILSKEVSVLTDEGEEIFFVKVEEHLVPGYEKVYSYLVGIE